MWWLIVKNDEFHWGKPEHVKLMYLLDEEKTGSFKGSGAGVFHSVFPLIYN